MTRTANTPAAKRTGSANTVPRSRTRTGATKLTSRTGSANTVPRKLAKSAPTGPVRRTRTGRLHGRKQALVPARTELDVGVTIRIRWRPRTGERSEERRV